MRSTRSRKPRLTQECRLEAWARFLYKLDQLYRLVRKWHASNNMVREMEHRSPAILGYIQAMILSEGELTVAGTVPPVTTKARGQTSRALTIPYPLHPDHCCHDREAARRIGNAHGRFRECTQCGLVMKALPDDYIIPITKEAVPVYMRSLTESEIAQEEKFSHSIEAQRLPRPVGPNATRFPRHQFVHSRAARLPTRARCLKPATSSGRPTRTSMKHGYLGPEATSHSEWEAVGTEDMEEDL